MALLVPRLLKQLGTCCGEWSSEDAMRGWKVLVCAAFFWCTNICAQTVSIGVFGVFRPAELTLTPVGKQELLVPTGGHDIFVAMGSECRALQIRASGNTLWASCGKKDLRAKEIQASSRNHDATEFVLTIAGKIKRNYRGTLRIVAKDGVLIPIVKMDLETAVGSVVGAEMTDNTPLEALKAQAIATRSYFAAGGGRHAEFDFCDLTHCQFLRAPPAVGTSAAKAADETRGMILTFNGKPVAAMFTRSCGGHTRTPQEIGLAASGYPYFSVICDFCYKNAIKWTRKVSPEDAALLRGGEAGRLSVGRRLGWDAVPSNNFTARKEGDKVVLEGCGQGHGIGLCQRGARAMAENHATFREILDHYFPNTKIESERAGR
jgi:stage II sporulation protein D